MIPKATLQRAVESVYPAVQRVHVLPVLTHIHIRSGKGGMTLTASDLKLQIVTNVGGEYPEMDVCVPADRLKSAVEVLTGELKFKVGKMLTITGDRGLVRLPIMADTEFPLMKVDGEVIAAFPFSLARDHMKRVAFAAAKKDIRYYLISVALISDGEDLIVASANGHVMAVCKLDTKLPKFEALIPPDIFAKIKDAETVKIGRQHAQFVGETANYTVSLIEGKFPDFARAFPNPDKAMRFNVSQMTGVASQIGNLYDFKDDKFIRIKCGEKIMVGADVDGQGGSFEIDGSGDELDANVRASYLVGILNNVFLGAAEATVMWDSTQKPHPFLMFENGNYKALVAPLRV